MVELTHSVSAEGASNASPDFIPLIASLRAAGAAQFDPVRLHYIEALARRSLGHEGNVRYLLDAKLAQALSAFQERLAGADANWVRHEIGSRSGAEHCTPVGTLLRQLACQSPEPGAGPREAQAGPRSELKTLRSAGNIWSTLSVEKQVAKALAQAPKNAGPINSHMLILRSLTLMRDISPDYLTSFMSYAETLLCLDQCVDEKSGNVKKQKVAKTVKKQIGAASAGNRSETDLKAI